MRFRRYKLERNKARYPFFAEYVRIYMNNPKNSARKFLHVINIFNKLAQYEIISEKMSSPFLFK